MSPTITGDTLTMRFAAPWTADSYDAFLASKRIPEAVYDYDEATDSYTLRAPSRFASVFGVEAPRIENNRLPPCPALFDYQAWALGLALDAKRFALWLDCGLGKTLIMLEWCRQVAHITGRPVLIMCPKSVIVQHIGEARRFMPDMLGYICKIETRAELKGFCTSGKAHLGIVNYEKMIPREGEPEVLEEMRWLGGIALDESSILKTGGGTIKWALIKSCRGIEYKLSCTATPAPNDTMEYASQAGFLERMRSEQDILWTYFKRNKAGEWEVKPHAREAFYRFMSSWSLYMRNPARYGFTSNPVHNVPDPVIETIDVPVVPEQSQIAMQYLSSRTGELMLTDRGLGVRERSKLSQIAKGFHYGDGKKVIECHSLKPVEVAAIAHREYCAHRQVIIWTTFDAEADILKRLLNGSAVVLDGATTDDERASIIDEFRRGYHDSSIRILISKPSLLGYGLNFQNVGAMIFSGWDDSYERFYQALRRAWRFGQTQPLRVFVPVIHELEGVILDNVLRKQAQWLADTVACEAAYAAALTGVEAAT